MPVAPGSRIGPYEITALVGEGGMGSVWRAHHTALRRDDALKVLPEAFASDPDRLARFRREAQVLASLNHPNIAHVYGLEQADGVQALVMELVEGPTLADRISQGPISLDEALPIAKQIAEALDAAHEQGIIHRDLKPANIKVRPDGTVKVLDFGLAKALEPAGAMSPSASQSPTITSPAMMTGVGVILGTAAYMSPEQARGKTVDKRADIWAFGVVVYEMLTGRALFAGDTVTDVLAAVVTREPDWSAVPSQARRLLTKCLEKEPRKRLRDIGDGWALLDPAGMGGPAVAVDSVSASWRRILPWAVAALLGAAATAAAIIHLSEADPQPSGPVRFQIQAALEAGSSSPAISPDGRRIVYQTSRGIFVRDVDAVEPRLLVTTDNAVGNPFWSADSRSIAYATSSKLMRVDATGGGPPQSICDLPGILLGALWTADDRVLLVTASGVQAVSARGGPVSKLALPPGVRLRSGHQALPDRQQFVYSVRQGAESARGIFVARLDGTGEPVRLLPESESDVAFVSAPDARAGYLLFLRQGALVAQAFDPDRTQLSGSPVVVATGVESFTASANGNLAYLASTTARRLTWFDRQGKQTGTAWAPGPYLELNLSPDGSRVAVVRADPPVTWVHDFSREASVQLSQRPSVKPIWSPDGNTLAYASGRVGAFDLYRAAFTSEGSGTALIESPTLKYPMSWSRDGRWLLYTNIDASTKEDLWVLPMSEREGATPEPFLVTDYSETDAAFSPDGRLVAYVSSESGMPEVWVRSFPAGTAGKWQISSGGGYQPRWSRSGRELLYISEKSELMSVAVTDGAGFRAASPQRLFPVPIYGGGASLNNRYWDVAADGQRFLVTTTGDGAGTSTLTVVLNFAEELKRLVQTP